ncbi:MAG: hypothetical protein ABIO50_01065 [Nitrosospira sp.]
MNAYGKYRVGRYPDRYLFAHKPPRYFLVLDTWWIRLLQLQADTMGLFHKLLFPFFVTSASSWAIAESSDPATLPLEEVVVTATRFSQRVEKLPIGVSVIHAEQIKNSAA